MRQNFVLTLSGPDRIGIVDRLTGLLFARGGNVETSRMARLGGEFAVLMLVSLPSDRLEGLDAELQGFVAEGFKVTTTAPKRTITPAQHGWIPFQIEVQGADHEGIIHEVSHYLSERGINIEAIDSETTLAPVSGSPLFDMTAQVAVPPDMAASDWEAGLAAIADRLNLDIRVTPAKT